MVMNDFIVVTIGVVCVSRNYLKVSLFVDEAGTGDGRTQVAPPVGPCPSREEPVSGFCSGGGWVGGNKPLSGVLDRYLTGF